MDKFEFYKQNKDNQELLYQEKKKMNLPEDSTQYDDAAEYLKEKFENRIKNSDYADRTNYYFKDNELLNAKVERYRSMANDENGQITAYAQKYGNKSAKKRKKNAVNAYETFTKAAEMQAGFNEEGKSAFDIYKHRKAVMKVRMEAKAYAALVKSKSDSDYEYRKAKSNLSSLLILKDQLDHLKGDKPSKQFRKEEAKLDKKIKEAEKILKNSGFQSLTKWKEENGLEKKDSVKAKLSAFQELNPEVKKEDAKIFMPLELVGKEFLRPEYTEAFEKAKASGTYELIEGDESRVISSITQPVMRDKNGLPINAHEKKKEEWNKRWLDAVSDANKAAERKTLIKEAIDRFEKFTIPKPEELKSKGVVYFFKKDPVNFYDMIHAATCMNGLEEADPVAKKMMRDNPLINKKINALTQIAALFHGVIKSNLITQTANGYQIEQNMSKEDIKELQFNSEAIITSYTEEYNNYKLMEEARDEEVNYQKDRKKAEEKIDSYEKCKAINSDMTEEKYQLFKHLQSVQNHRYHDSRYRKLISYGKKKGTLKYAKQASEDATRLFSAVMKDVYLDENGEPLTEQDKKNDEWNMKLMQTVAEGNMEEREEMIAGAMEEAIDLDFQFPSPEQLRQGWIENEIKKDSNKIEQILRVGLTLSNLYKYSPYAEKNYKHREDVDKWNLMVGNFTQVYTIYMQTKYRINGEFGDSAKVEKESVNKMYTDNFLNDFINSYQSEYNNYMEYKNKKKG